MHRALVSIIAEISAVAAFRCAKAREGDLPRGSLDLGPEAGQVIRRVALLCCAVLAATACGPPIEVRHVSARRARQIVASNALTTGEISRRTQNLLYEQDLVERY